MSQLGGGRASGSGLFDSGGPSSARALRALRSNARAASAARPGPRAGLGKASPGFWGRGSGVEGVQCSRGGAALRASDSAGPRPPPCAAFRAAARDSALQRRGARRSPRGQPGAPDTRDRL